MIRFAITPEIKEDDRIAELLKENAELKADLKKCRDKLAQLLENYETLWEVCVK